MRRKSLNKNKKFIQNQGFEEEFGSQGKRPHIPKVTLHGSELKILSVKTS